MVKIHTNYYKLHCAIMWHMLKEILPAQLSIQPNGTPFAENFGDPYFSNYDGLAESRHVFIQGNHLPERWQNKAQFVIAETGFGTGLNFLATWQAWQNDPQRCATLHFISIEKHPIPREKLIPLLENWPELANFSGELLENYPSLLAGFHHLILAEGQIHLTLCFMDIQDALAELTGNVNAWYLDGFAPARNESMWSETVLKVIASLSATHASLATYTVAGSVRRHLMAAGFCIEKQTGFAQKRHMLIGELADDVPKKTLLTWFNRPQITFNKKALVIGAGVAGCQIAYALARKGWHIELLERHRSLAREASGNRAGVIIPKMTAEPDWGERFYRSAFLFALNQLQFLEKKSKLISWNKCGSLQINHDERESKRWLALKERSLPEDFIQLVDAQTASHYAGIHLNTNASYFPQGAWINPASLCTVLTEHENINLHFDTIITELEQHTNSWKAYPETGAYYQADVVIVASGQEAASFAQTKFLPLVPIRGQTSHAQATATSQHLKVTLGHEGYVTPAWQEQHVFGATFERGSREAVCDNTRDAENLQQLTSYLPEWASALGAVSSGHCAIRVASPDRYPCVGAVPDPLDFMERYHAIRHGQQHKNWPEVKYQTGLFISAAYGSRGLTTSALCSELLACLINGEPLPLELSLYYKLHPARFLLRRLQQNRT